MYLRKPTRQREVREVKEANGKGRKLGLRGRKKVCECFNTLC